MKVLHCNCSFYRLFANYFSSYIEALLYLSFCSSISLREKVVRPGGKYILTKLLFWWWPGMGQHQTNGSIKIGPFSFFDNRIMDGLVDLHISNTVE